MKIEFSRKEEMSILIVMMVSVIVAVGLFAISLTKMSEDECYGASTISVTMDKMLDVCGNQATNDQGGAQRASFMQFKTLVKSGSADVYLGTSRRYMDGSCSADILAVSGDAGLLQLLTGEGSAQIICKVNGIVE